MGRYSSTKSTQLGTTDDAIKSPANEYFTAPYVSGSSLNQNQFNQPPNPGEIALQQARAAWPSEFPKAIVGLDRDGVINVDRGFGLTSIDDWEPIPGSYEAIRTLRLKGYKVVILTNQGGISEGKQTHDQVDAIHDYMLKTFGEAGIFSIDGLFYAESSMKNDYYAKPNVGMFHRAEKELFFNKARFKQGGYYVGDKITDLKAAYKIGARPVLVRTGYGNDTESQLDKFSLEKIKKKTKIFDSLLDFANSLE
jgi:D-glycero-D-manno-heptose 1,7-bisphosphate phosphatase